MIQETDTGVNSGCPCTVKVKAEPDAGLCCFAGNCCFSVHFLIIRYGSVKSVFCWGSRAFPYICFPFRFKLRTLNYTLKNSFQQRKSKPSAQETGGIPLSPRYKPKFVWRL